MQVETGAEIASSLRTPILLDREFGEVNLSDLAIAFAIYGVPLESSCNFWCTTVTGILMVYHWNPNEIDGLPLASY